MSRVIVLDSSPLGLLANPTGSVEAAQCSVWLASLLTSGVKVILPEIIDYELRRELLRAGFVTSVAELNTLKSRLVYLPLTTDAMLTAAEFWAEVRRQGRPTSDEKALDIDVILAAQAAALTDAGDTVVIATSNVAHISRFAEASLWRNSPPLDSL